MELTVSGNGCIDIAYKDLIVSFFDSDNNSKLKKSNKKQVQLLSEYSAELNQDDQIILNHAGELEVGEVSILGIDIEQEGKSLTAYRVDGGGLMVAFLPSSATKELPESAIEELSGIDVLVACVGENEDVPKQLDSLEKNIKLLETKHIAVSAGKSVDLKKLVSETGFEIEETSSLKLKEIQQAESPKLFKLV